MNFLIQNIRNIRNMTTGKQREYWDIRLSLARPVVMSRLADIFSSSEIEHIRIAVKPCIKQCYANAQRFCLYFPEADYIEGEWALMGYIPISHAFNYIRGRYVDITTELCSIKANNIDVATQQYIQLIQLNSKQVAQRVLANNCYDSIVDDEIRHMLH